VDCSLCWWQTKSRNNRSSRKRFSKTKETVGHINGERKMSPYRENRPCNKTIYDIIDIFVSLHSEKFKPSVSRKISTGTVCVCHCVQDNIDIEINTDSGSSKYEFYKDKEPEIVKKLWEKCNNVSKFYEQQLIDEVFNKISEKL